MWGNFWVEQGYVALHVDSFGPRGYVSGFPQGSYQDRPPEVSEKDVRPLDAYGAMAWLISQPIVKADSIGLQGWSNGAMTTLWATSDKMPKRLRLEPQDGFRAALALYPGCRRVLREETDYNVYAPLLMLLAGDDDETPPGPCQELLEGVRDRPNPGPIEYHIYRDADHNFDDPNKEDPANVAAREDAKIRAKRFFHAHLETALAEK
jgi:carboxymethylenebutenolidase